MTFSTNYREIDISSYSPKGIYKHVTPVPDSILLTREQLEKMIVDAYETGELHKHYEHLFIPSKVPGKKQYINSLIK